MFSKGFSFRRKQSEEGHPGRTANASISRGSLSSVQDDDAGSLHSGHETAASTISSRHSSESDPGPLGLNVVYTPENGHKADIVFIHGLGGSSRMTWSKYKNPELFWPLTFLPLEPDICLARILSFGYEANFRKAGNISTAILDFAKTLLYDLKYATGTSGEDLNMGNVPLLFVVHSMGGLIVKEAYMQGQNDPEYEKIVKAISAITFLSTPHRGTNLADLLNRILQSTGVSNAKQYVSELAKNSFTLQKLNEQFRHIAPRLDIVSFYETQPTSIGLKSARVMVLEKDSSVLGYPGETSKAMNADHHGICKFENTQDPNYITVKNILKSLMGKIVSTSSATRSKRPLQPHRKESRDLKALLAISGLPDEDYVFFRDQWTQGTSNWILDEKAYIDCVQTPVSTSRLLWLHGGAAAGKSVLSSFIINNLVEQGACCQYFFIRFGDRQKKTLAFLLRSIAYQVAQQVPEFSGRVVELIEEGIDFATAEPKTIWERIYKSVLFKMETVDSMYWIIDGLDEADDPRSTIRLLSDVVSSYVPIRIILVSRETPEIITGLKRCSAGLEQSSLSIGRQLEDLRYYISQELTMPGSPEFVDSVTQRLVEGSQGNFLWVRLAVEKINSCHTHAEVERALSDSPPGMEAIYDRMALSIANNPDKALVEAILYRITCSFRVLTVPELSQSLNEDVSEMLDFQQSVVKLCGGFVVIDNGGNIAMIHQTAREYLLGDTDRPFQIRRTDAHEQLLLSCLRCLMTNGLQAKSNRSTSLEFFDYSANWWSSHLHMSASDSDPMFDALHRFLTGRPILAWIHFLAAEKQLRILIRASKDLSKYTVKRNSITALRAENLHIVEQQFVESLAVDFVKLVGKFGSTLLRNPESIYKLIPPFCPQDSAIYQLFGKKETKTLMVSGFSTQNWDDSLARFSLGVGAYASSILAAGAHIAMLASSGSALIYDSSTFQEVASSPIKHGERLYRMHMNRTGSLLVTYGFKTTKIWELSSGTCKVSVQNLDSRPRPLTMLLTSNNSTLLVGTDDRKIRSLSLTDASPTWELVAELEEPELEGHFLNSSSYMDLSNDGSCIVVAYRGHPLSAWELDGPVHINHCWRARDEVARGEVIEAMWHPFLPEVLGLYIEGVVFKWNPYEGEPEEISTGASRLAMSSDGEIFATGDVHGTVKIYTRSEFSLLYQLVSQDTVFDLAFSPDSRRIYDVRGYYGNAWEPNALMRYAEHTEAKSDDGSETESIVPSFMASSSTSQRIDSITVVAASPLGKLYCCGTEYGVVRLLDTIKGKLAEIHISKGFLSIEQLTWSDDGNYIMFSDSSKKVFLLSLTYPYVGSDPEVKPNAEISLKKDTKGPILQLLFEPDSTHFLVYTSSTLCVISTETNVVTNSINWPSDKFQWIVHPQDPALMIGLGPSTVQTLDWNLTSTGVHQIKYPSLQPPTSDIYSPTMESVVDRVLVAPNKRHILVQTSRGQNSKEKDLLWFATSSFLTPASVPSTNSTENLLIITPAIVSRDLTTRIASALSIISQDRLIFLSKTFSICSFRIPMAMETSAALPPAGMADSGSVVAGRPGVPAVFKRHHSSGTGVAAQAHFKEIFALPGDWISRECLTLCSIWRKEGSFLCPRNGEVAVVRSAGLV